MSDIVKVESLDNGIEKMHPIALATTSVDLIDEFIPECDVSESSRKTYRRGILNYFRWVAENGVNLNSASIKEIILYKTWLERDPDIIAGSTANSYLMSVKKFYEWAEGRKKYPNIAAGVKLSKADKKFLKEPLNEEEVDKLLLYFLNREGKRDLALAAFLIGTATRTIEASRANIGDLRFKDGKRICWIHGKGRKDKNDYVVIAPELYPLIDDYILSRGVDANASSPLFVSESKRNAGSRMTSDVISGTIKDGLRGIGIDDPRYTAHSLRHTGAILMMEHGANINRIKHVLRHYSVETTENYSRVFDERQRLQEAPEELLGGIFQRVLKARAQQKETANNPIIKSTSE